LTLNLNGVSGTSHSPTSPTKLCNLPSSIPLVPLPIEKNVNNKNESVTVTHFSDLHGGIVEKISVPVSNDGSNFKDNNNLMKSEFTSVKSPSLNNPFVDEFVTTTATTTTTPSSTNPFSNSFTSNESNDLMKSPSEKSVKISFSIGGKNNKNPFQIETIEEMDFNESDVVDNNENNLSSISSINMKIDNNNETNVTTIKMDAANNNNVQNGCSPKKVTALCFLRVSHL
jgi:hypothetical protein